MLFLKGLNLALLLLLQRLLIVFLHTVGEYDSDLPFLELVNAPARNQIHQDGLFDLKRVELFFYYFVDQEAHDHAFDRII